MDGKTEIGRLTTKEVLATALKKQLPNGDILYTSPQYLDGNFIPKKNLKWWDEPVKTEPFSLIISPEGQTLMSKTKLLSLIDYPAKPPRLKHKYKGGGFLSEYAVKENIGNFGNPFDVALIQFGTEYIREFSGIDRFRATRILESEGVQAAKPLLATRWKYVSQFIPGKPASEFPKGSVELTLFEEYLTALNTLAKRLYQEGRWQKTWAIDGNPANYLLIEGLNKNIIFQKFIGIDPVQLYKGPDLYS